MQKERLNSHVPARIKRVLKDIANDQKRPVNDVVVDALNEYINRVNHTHSAPDLVLDRLNQLFNVQIQHQQTLSKILRELEGQ